MQAICSGYATWLRMSIVMMLLLVPACNTRPASEHRVLEVGRMVDLAHVIAEDMPQGDYERPVQFAYDANDYTVRAVQLDVRSGTRLTLLAPPDQVATVDQLSPRDQLVPAVVINVREQAWNDPTFRLDTQALLAWETHHGPIPSGSIVLLATGWDMHWGKSTAYLNRDRQGNLQAPGFSADVLRLLTDERRILGIGVDTPSALIASPDMALPEGTGSWWLLENLTRLEQLPATGSHLVIGSLRIQASRSSPASVLALVP